ncbi:endonuclease/exonuclease/phosphatase family protein [Georgenia sp. SYP-B2076]|uniref:endonuclease/exonuclease/phosphatase family protein n=1 Tax=Georgenia sp. SYP-B2076 TaxID=2495881 RepID=UPI000F8D1F3F|nr:endonuclease/exonuclease/phosphatase family protein [Georgenia sp. SYP-B2076]
MKRVARVLGALAVTALAGGALAPAAAAGQAARARDGDARPAPVTLRVASYDVSLARAEPGELVADLAAGDRQARAVAEVIQITAPDVVVLGGIDTDPAGEAVDLFRERYLEVAQHGETPVAYPYAFTAPVNAGAWGSDDGDGDAGTLDGSDGGSFGGGASGGPGAGMAVLSRYPIDTASVRTFRTFLWKDMPGALLPDHPPAPADLYGAGELERLPLSSSSHWDVPVDVHGTSVHVLAAQPAPASGEEVGRLRNHDEIRFWADYIGVGGAGEYIYDDAGRPGGLTPGARFVVAGDLGADPADGPGHPGAIAQLLDHPRLRDPEPASGGAVEAGAVQRVANVGQAGDPALDTADLADDPGPGNLRLDYVLPSRNLRVLDAGVFWPMADQPGSELTGQRPFPTSAHRLVWADVRVPAWR